MALHFKAFELSKEIFYKKGKVKKAHELEWPNLSKYLDDMQNFMIDLVKSNVADPVNIQYNLILRSIKQLCDTPNITDIIINQLINKNKGKDVENSNALEKLTDAAQLLLDEGVTFISDKERDFLTANVLRIKMMCEQEMGIKQESVNKEQDGSQMDDEEY